MAYPVFQSLLTDYIWMLLLQRIILKVPVLMLLYLILDNLYGYFSCLEDLFGRSGITPVI